MSTSKHLLAGLAGLIICATCSNGFAGGPYVVPIETQEHWQDQRGDLIPQLDHANPNAGGSDIPWETQKGRSSDVSWSVNVTTGSDTLGLKIGGALSGTQTVSLASTQSGVVEAPPASYQGCNVANHDTEYFAYEGYAIDRQKVRYWTTNGGYVAVDPAITILHAASRDWISLGGLITYKEHQEGYGDDNYARPDPYVKDVHKIYTTPHIAYSNILKASEIGTVFIVPSNNQRDYS